jgi:histidinol dehydrogenase
MAAKARRLARSIGDEQVTRGLEDYAAELDRIAVDLERRAVAAKAQGARSRRLAAEISSEVTEAKARLDQLHRTLKRSDGDPEER